MLFIQSLVLVLHLSIFQTGRSRKCSIVQEEEDDEDDVTGAGHEELSTPLNRRGSRSEGRLNITVQDRIAESERLKLEAKKQAEAKEKELLQQQQLQLQQELEAKENAAAGMLGGFVGIGNVTLITSENSCTKERLGIAGGGLHRKVPEIKRGMDFPKKTSILKPQGNVRGGSFDKCIASIKDAELVSTKIISDSATITMPLTVNIVNTSSIPKYKTMPSPTRVNTILNTNTNCLNEIFEEGTDVGSSDSTTTTPRPVIRNQFNARAQSQGGNGNNVHRRTKFNKSRTASCSSSDASDDDSENRKKRAHKIVDSTVKPQTQRRDSHDDSSDSQDPGNAAAPSSTGACVRAIMTGAASSSSNNDAGNQPNTEKRNSGNGNRQKSSQQVDFRRHRGRRRPVETRLRESQSLNRITEVQESETSHSAAAAAPAAAAAGAISSSTVPIDTPDGEQPSQTTATTTTTTSQEEYDPKDEFSNNVNHPDDENNEGAVGNSSTNNTPNTGSSSSGSSHPSKPKGFSARIFHPFKKQHYQPSSNSSTPSVDMPAEALKTGITTSTTAPSGDDIEIVVELAKALNASESSGKSTKKIKILGRYFQVSSDDRYKRILELHLR